MSKFLENLAALLKVKTLVTLAVIIVFVVLALTGAIDSDNVMQITLMVIAFYFGTQHEKTGTAEKTTMGAGTVTVAQLPAQAYPVTESVDHATYFQTHPDSE